MPVNLTAPRHVPTDPRVTPGSAQRCLTPHTPTGTRVPPGQSPCHCKRSAALPYCTLLNHRGEVGPHSLGRRLCPRPNPPSTLQRISCPIHLVTPRKTPGPRLSQSRSHVQPLTQHPITMYTKLTCISPHTPAPGLGTSQRPSLPRACLRFPVLPMPTYPISGPFAPSPVVLCTPPTSPGSVYVFLVPLLVRAATSLLSIMSRLSLYSRSLPLDSTVRTLSRCGAKRGGSSSRTPRQGPVRGGWHSAGHSRSTGPKRQHQAAQHTTRPAADGTATHTTHD